RTTSFVQSVDPSSTIIISKSSKVWFKTLSMVSPIKSARLYVGMITLTRAARRVSRAVRFMFRSAISQFTNRADYPLSKNFFRKRSVSWWEPVRLQSDYPTALTAPPRSAIFLLDNVRQHRKQIMLIENQLFRLSQ